jgi:hypothetical protein
VPELDLDAIKARWAIDTDPDDPCADVQPLIAEVERLRRLLGESSPTSDAYESAVAAMGAYRSLAEELLSHFRPYAMDGDRVVSMRCPPVPVETYTRWRAVLGGGS